jgi:hypothetical protein
VHQVGIIKKCPDTGDARYKHEDIRTCVCLITVRVSLPGIGVMRMESDLFALVNKPAVCLFVHLCYRARAKASLIATLLGTA